MSNKEARLPIWRALSDLFLDTEISETTYSHIARTIVESGFTVNEVEAILWHEVYPVLRVNLYSVAGVWDGWSDTWLLENLSICEKPGAIRRIPFIKKEIECCWSRVVELLPNNNDSD